MHHVVHTNTNLFLISTPKQRSYFTTNYMKQNRFYLYLISLTLRLSVHISASKLLASGYYAVLVRVLCQNFDQFECVRNIVTNTTFLLSNIQNLSTSIQGFIPLNIAPKWIMMPACFKPSLCTVYILYTVHTDPRVSMSVPIPFFTCTHSKP